MLTTVTLKKEEGRGKKLTAKLAADTRGFSYSKIKESALVREIRGLKFLIPPG
jgi:hypothetical protein